MRKVILMIILAFYFYGSMAQNARYTLTFDGVNDYIPLNTNFGITTSFSVEFWFKTSTTVAACLFGQSTVAPTATPTSFVPVICITSAGTLRAEAWTGALGDITTSMAVNDGKWHHVAFTVTSSTQVLYVDGQLIGTRSGTLNITWWSVSQIGTGYDANTRLGGSAAWKYIAGNMDEIRIWNVDLSQNTVQNWFLRRVNSAHPNYANLIAYYNLDEGSGTVAHDTSQNYYDGTLTNFSSSPWSPSYAPLISEPSRFVNDLAVTWPVKTVSSSSVLSIADTLSGNTYIVYGHLNNSLAYDSNHKPSMIKKRLSRSWRIEKEGNLNGTIIFDYSGLDTSGFYTYKLLVSADTSFYTASVFSGIKTGGRKIRFYNISFQDSVFYTFGTYDFQLPTVTTVSVSQIKAYTAKVNATVLDDGGYTTTRGVCWSTSANPTVALPTKTINGTGKGSFQANLTGLNANTTYHVRAYATNMLGTSYGADSVFTTPVPVLPVVQTSGKVSLFADSVYYRGNVLSEGNDDVTERGFCWGASPNPVISGNKVISGYGGGIFNKMITGLIPSTTYHVRAYAINSVGTSYGADSTFNTLQVSVPAVVTGKITAITGDSVKAKGTIPFDGRRQIIQKGFCWSTSPNPTVVLSTKSAQGGDTSSFSYYIHGLQPNTIYHVRAYATNVIGTAYGGDSIFLTAAAPVAVIRLISSISYLSASVTAEVTSDGRLPVTSRGICYDTAVNPDLKKSLFRVSGSGTGLYPVSLTGLTHNTVYHVRAFAINGVDTSYSADTSFKTLQILPPAVNTYSISAITSKSAYVIGTISSDGGSAITRKGFCWSTLPIPKASLPTKSLNGSGTATFSYTITNLARGTTYHVRAYAINAIDTAYGGDSTFTTQDAPRVTTDSVILVNTTSVMCGGNVTSSGGLSVTKRGVCWNTLQNPTAKLSTKTSDGFGLGTFSSTVTPLVAGTTYYIRAYAINGVDTAYGIQRVFRIPVPPVVTTSVVDSVTSRTASSGGTVISGDSIIERGVAWDLHPNPGITLPTRTSDGQGTGSFNSRLLNLLPDTTYYVRAYARNIISVSYGSGMMFKTGKKMSVITVKAEVNSPSSIYAEGNILLDGGFPVIIKGFSWAVSSPDVYLLTDTTNNGIGTGSFSVSINSLNADIPYYIRAFAINSYDTVFGDEKTVMISPPVVVTGSALNKTDVTAVLSGLVNARGNQTHSYFEYGKTIAYGNSVNGIPDNTVWTGDSIVTANLASLEPSATYHFRLVAESLHGKTFGTDSVFTMEASSLPESLPQGFILINKKGKLYLSYPDHGNKKVELSLFDVTGKELYHGIFKGNDAEYEWTEANSMVIIRLVIDQNIYYRKLPVVY